VITRLWLRGLPDCGARLRRSIAALDGGARWRRSMAALDGDAIHPHDPWRLLRTRSLGAMLEG